MALSRPCVQTLVITDGAVPLDLQRASHSLFAEAIMVFPGIVEEVHAGVQGLVDNLSGFRVGVYRAEVVSANS